MNSSCQYLHLSSFLLPYESKPFACTIEYSIKITHTKISKNPDPMDFILIFLLSLLQKTGVNLIQSLLIRYCCSRIAFFINVTYMFNNLQFGITQQTTLTMGLVLKLNEIPAFFVSTNRNIDVRETRLLNLTFFNSSERKISRILGSEILCGKDSRRMNLFQKIVILFVYLLKNVYEK